MMFNLEAMSRHTLKQQFDMDCEEHDNMKHDIADITRWYYENTSNMTLQEKRLFCLNFFMNSGTLYIIMLKCSQLPLLGIEDLKLLDLNFDTGVSNDLMKYLKFQLDYWEPTTKYVNLVLDETPLKMGLQYDEATDKVIGFQDIDGVRSSDFASKALLISAQGCLDAFYQPLGYAFLSEADSTEKLISWMIKVIQQLENSGFTVCSVVSRQIPVFLKLVNRLGITAQKPYFKVDGKKIFYMFHPINLLIAIRDLLVNSNLFYDNNKLISWSDIVDIHKHFKLLTEAHINPDPIKTTITAKDLEEQKDLALEIFKPVIHDLIFAKYAHAPLKSGTASFLRTIYNVYEHFTDIDGSEPSYTGSEQQIKAFKKALSMIQRIKLPNKQTHTDISCLSGLQMTINSIMQMQKHSKSEVMKRVYVLMFDSSRMLLHQEEIQSSVWRSLLTPTQFKYGFSKAMVDSLIRNPVNDSVSSCFGPMLNEASSDDDNDDEGKDCDRLLDSIHSGTFEVLFKDHLYSTNAKRKRRHVPK